MQYILRFTGCLAFNNKEIVITSSVFDKIPRAVTPTADRGFMATVQQGTTNATRVVVATTVALSFISFWRGAAIVLSDLASSAFYVGGIAEGVIGKSAPWFILAVMFFSFAVRSIYLESCSMYVRGGVYVVVRDAMGPFLARLSVSALIFDYILTGPISAVSAGLYLGHLLTELAEFAKIQNPMDPAQFAMIFGLVVTV